MSNLTIKTIRHLKGVGILADTQVGKFDFEFSQYNLIYGFNGSGKTTLSRIIDSFSENGINEKLEETADFSLELSDGSKPTSTTPHTRLSRYIAVFNEDYVEKSLFWAEGTAEPIIYLGEEQADLAKSIEALEKQEESAAADEILSSAAFSSAEKAEANFSRDIAKLISAELGLGRSYNATNLRNDYSRQFSPDDKLAAEAQKSLKETINKTDLPNEIDSDFQRTSLVPVAKQVNDALRVTLTSMTIQNLERRKDALEWVRQGIDLHSGEVECLFCGNELLEQRTNDLRDALSDGFEQFKEALGAAKRAAKLIKAQCSEIREKIVELGEVLPPYSEPLANHSRDAISRLKNGESLIDEWISLLETKLERPEEIPQVNMLPISEWESGLSHAISQLEATIEKNNASLRNFSKEQDTARNDLKAHHLADNQSEFRSITALVQNTKEKYDKVSQTSKQINQQIIQKKESLRNHKAAASEMNELLAGYLGHNHIQLVTDEEGYQIARNGSVDPKPLSEGERTAIAFCHFLATLKSEGRNPKDFVVVLDDPISSLDARAMTHAVAMIQRNFGAPNQLFVLTHNLDFMREIKKWLGRKYKTGDAQFLFVECSVSNEGRSSKVVKMPKLIREYESEYHYLYSLVKLIADTGEDHSTFAYLMPNAIRKVLDIFLAFKVPGGSGLSPKVDKIIADFEDLDANMIKSMERLAHLESHSESVGDVTTFSAYTFEQIIEAAKALLTLIETVDPEHKKAMDRLCQ